MTKQLLALDKCPGVRPVGVGEAWLRLMAKAALTDAGGRAKAACGSTQLCAGLEAGIEGALHAVREATAEEMVFEDWEVDDAIWRREAVEGEIPPWERVEEEEDEDGEEEDEEIDPDAEVGVNAAEEEEETQAAGFGDAEDDGPMVSVAIDARNGFNALRRYAMLWTCRHPWAKGSRFLFNCYRHFIRLIVRRDGDTPLIIYSEEGVTQGCVFAMLAYGIALLPLCEGLERDCPKVMQPRFADDGKLVGRAKPAAECFGLMARRGPSVGYYPEDEKSWCVCTRADEAEARRTFEEAGLKVQYTRGCKYVGGFVGSKAMMERWIKPKVERWAAVVDALARVVRKYPHMAWAGMRLSLQAEWQCICRCEPSAGDYLQPVESAIREAFLPALLQQSEPLTDEFRQLLGQGVKGGGLAIPDPCKGAARQHQASKEACEELVASLRTGDKLHLSSHQVQVRKAGATMRKEKVEGEKEWLKGLAESKGARAKKRLERMPEVGQWLSCIPSRFDGTEISTDVWHDNVSLRYGFRPEGLPQRCDGCGEAFTVEHALQCKKGGLVGIRHDDQRDEFGHLAGCATSNSRITYEPKIFYGGDAGAGPQRTTQEAEEELGDEARGDVAVHGFWKRGRTTIFDVRITDTDAKSYGNTASEKILAKHEREKKGKYEEACRERRRDFTPLVYSVDGMPGKEAKAAERRLAALLAKKWSRRYSEMANFVRVRMSLSVIRSNTLLLRGERATGWQKRGPEDGVAAGAACHAIRED